MYKNDLIQFLSNLESTVCESVVITVIQMFLGFLKFYLFSFISLNCLSFKYGEAFQECKSVFIH